MIPMRILRLSVLFFLVLSQSTLAQVSPRPVTETLTLIKEAADILGPKVGPILYEDQPILVFAGIQPVCLLPVANLDLNEDQQSHLASFGKKHSLKFDVEYQGLKITSPLALQDYTANSKFEWLVPFNQGDDPTEWAEKLDETAEKALGGLTRGVGFSLLQGAPDSVVTSELRAHKSFLDSARIIDVLYPETIRLVGERPGLRVLPELASSADLKEWTTQREHYLRDFFDQERVRLILRRPDFLAARKVLRDNEDVPSIEAWLRKDKFDSLPTGEYRSSELNHQKEQILVAHSDDWVSMIESHSPPSKWLEQFNIWSVEAGFQPAIDGSDFKTWLWMGAHEKSSSRASAYRAAKEASPNRFRSIAKEDLQQWLEYYAEAGPNMMGNRRLLVVFGHPEVQAYFSALPGLEKARITVVLLPFAQEADCKELLASPPYSLKKTTES